MRTPLSLAGLLAGLAALCLVASPVAASTSTDIVTRAVEGFVRPAYADFLVAAGKLSQASTALCAAPSAEALEADRAAFRDTVRAWSAAEIIRFGPITEGNRLERVLFWPDRKGTGLRQVQQALASEDATATDPATLAGKSVAMQGLGALEFVLFGTGSDELASGAAYRCRYGAAIGANIETIAAEIDAAWRAPDGFAREWENPGADNLLYRDDSEALSELLDTFVTGLELVRDVRLGGFLGEETKQDKPRQAIWWRSDMTVQSLAANLDAMRRLQEASGLAGALSPDMGWIGESALFEFGNAASAAAAAEGPVDEVLADPERRGKLVYFGLVTSSLSQIFGERLSAELGLTAGFSSLDGD